MPPCPPPFLAFTLTSQRCVWNIVLKIGWLEPKTSQIGQFIGQVGQTSQKTRLKGSFHPNFINTGPNRPIYDGIGRFMMEPVGLWSNQSVPS